jgi:beta-N-acetylhexosaminidase
MRTMSLPDQAAQLVMPWITGAYSGFDAETFAQAVSWVDSLHVGGIVVSIGSPLDIAAQLNHLQRRSKLPLLIAADLEGGSAYRFDGGTPFPTNMGVGASGREQDAYQMGRITALEGRAVGVRWTFSPVADVNDNPANPIINTRSFGADPAAVARLVAAAVRGTQDAGVMATVKHFPGHGDTDVDSHLSLPVVRAGWDRLDRVELVPFKAAVKAGVDAVMSGHLADPVVEGGAIRPATLSPLFLTKVLRDSLGFRGIVVTDALDMGALVATYGEGEAAVLALQAGADVLLKPTDPAEAVRAVVAAVRSGRISRARLARSVARVLAAKDRLHLFERRTVSLDRIPDVVGRQAFLDTAAAVSARAMVLARDSLGVVERLRQTPGPISLVTFGEANGATLGNAFATELRARGYRVAPPFRLYPTSGPASYDSAATALTGGGQPLVLVSVRVQSSKGSVAIPEPLGRLLEGAARDRSAIVVSFGSPYILAQAPSSAGYLLAWTANPLTERAAARALAGAPITGRLPIDLPPFYRIGDGLTRSATARYADSTAR